MALEKQSQDSPQSAPRSQRTAHQSASAFSVPSVVNGSSDGYRVTYLPVDRDGLHKLADLEAAITDQTALVSLMWPINETGVLFPVEQIAEICRARGVLYHCDAVQAAGKVPADVRKIPVDYISVTGHKFHAPKGIGALYVRRGAPFSPLVYGGHQGRNRRGGTESMPLIEGTEEAVSRQLDCLHLTSEWPLTRPESGPPSPRRECYRLTSTVMWTTY
jgi:cysteine sulfinate desulfinase/cysteine desulfurase-like protein